MAAARLGSFIVTTEYSFQISSQSLNRRVSRLPVFVDLQVVSELEGKGNPSSQFRHSKVIMGAHKVDLWLDEVVVLHRF